jgi:hypothetical protein
VGLSHRTPASANAPIEMRPEWAIHLRSCAPEVRAGTGGSDRSRQARRADRRYHRQTRCPNQVPAKPGACRFHNRCLPILDADAAVSGHTRAPERNNRAHQTWNPECLRGLGHLGAENLQSSPVCLVIIRHSCPWKPLTGSLGRLTWTVLAVDLTVADERQAGRKASGWEVSAEVARSQLL